jgi:predicted metalloprotease with PDZ domain
LDLLTFQDFLGAVGRAFDVYLSAPERDKLSLIEASKRRWTISPSLVYQKSMLVALIYDLALRARSKGKHSLEDVYRELFRRHRLGSARTDANSAVIRVMHSFQGMEGFARSYLESASPIDLPAILTPFGLRVEKIGSRSRVSPADSLNREQRDLLRGLGYNTESRGPHRD